LSLPHDIDSVAYEVEQCFYRIGQEAIENAARHAQAESLAVELDCGAAGLELRIADDGIGFDPLAVDIEGKFGLKGMRERAQLIGAVFELASRPGGGTRVRLAWSPGDGRKVPS
jgi:signal transduction histidine kinase